ncbi:hypothetical protein [Crossiella sp. CA198]|uniref:hypothetical protein n=1 Tax=Crossiella sp. CA198 TaxID=3455607 RepID=UPI003F8D1594
MAYTVILTTRAEVTLAAAAPPAQAAFERKRRQLASDPESAGRFNPKDGAWYANVGDHGSIRYSIEHGVITVLVWDIVLPWG